MPTIRNAAQTATTEHPTGTAGGAAAMLTILIAWLLGELDVDVPPEVAAAVVGLVTVIVSKLTPRFDARRQVAHNDPPAGGTGPG